MLKIAQEADCQSILINNKWFQGEIHIDNRATIFPFQLIILNEFIDQIIAQANEVTGINLNFNIVISGDPKESNFAVDLFAFLDGIVINDQNIFNNPFSAIHWGLSTIVTTMSQLYDGLLNQLPTDFFEQELNYEAMEYIEKPTIN
ncbi:hypothetical protein GW933_01510 [Candidatus Falkowbacteria bacterium]|uniref:Uncharacterized protein n=1 Tax=Candidatus Buchananbacteria bacterium CG10_big_fil_rev_8_21_14_0_10_33_19 TaxID=1974525 RepID=A0A2H0W3I7_9BACT|nr:hypothetical protein [Candidatus Falkowbacteria bacterium]PIS05928.1 MAG: hypothetical protein COT80_04130 [Candidatus Buchananbacteria bacterium CG10_big_fil_rev_8_21_14_0_10_33_19]